MTPQKTIIIILIMLATAAITSMASHSEKIAPNKPFSQFPLEIDSWKGSKGELDDRVYNILGVEDYILANYVKSPSEKVNVYVGFYQSQKEGDIIHSPKNCLPGSGWKITKTNIENIQINGSINEIKVIKLLLTKGAEKQVVLYWFQSRGRIISSEYMQKIWLVIDSVIKHRTDGSFVRLTIPILDDEKTATRTLKDFARTIYPILNQFIPS